MTDLNTAVTGPTVAGTAALITNLTFDELQPGQRAQLQRTLSMDDIKAFARVSGDVNPAHLDEAWAETTRFHGVIAHGMWAGALISSLLGTEFPGPGTIYLAQSLNFHRPVRVGDTLTVGLTVRDKNPDNFNVALDCEVLNQKGERVVSGEALVRAPNSRIARPRPALPEMHLFDPEGRLLAWVDSLGAGRALPAAVVHPCDEPTLRGTLEAARRGLIVPQLLAPEAKLRALADRLGLSLAGVQVVDVPHSHAAAQLGARLAARGEVRLLVKGSLHTVELMQAVLAERALRTGRRMSHVFRMDVPAHDRPLWVTDAVLHIAPALEHKADILRNAIDLVRSLGTPTPRVALLSAVETVSARVASTLDAAALCKMADRGQIVGGLLDGPLSFDSAVSPETARVKALGGVVAGQADILLVPDMEAGSMLTKQLETLAGAAACGVVLGGRVPIALSQRAASASTCLASIALAAQGVQPMSTN